MSSATPTIIAGRYELQRRLAQGGMAEVWLATDLTLDRKVAVKWLKPTLATDPIVAERFRREAIAAASLNHPNIVAVHDVFEQDGRQAVVMQLVDGKSLRQLLDTQNRLSPELTCHIGTAVAMALDNAHQAGFVHRDVKPGNIMITPDGRVLLTDFGIAKGLTGDGSDDLTNDNIMMGTAKYLSPEQVRGKRLDGRADFYSLGLVLYECLAGRVPFLGETDADTALARLQRDPTDLARLRATLPTRLVGVVHALLARRPEDRPIDGAALIAELKAAQEEGPPRFDETGDELSPVAPFSAGRLVRAPSDTRGRIQDRSRGIRQPTPPRGKEGRSGDGRVGPDKKRRPTAPDSGHAVTEHTSAPSGPVGIPGEPPHITGRVPIGDQPTPSSRVAVTRADPPPPIHPAQRSANDRDRTPRSGPQRGAPARGMSQKVTPSATLVGILIAIAVVIAIVLWFTLLTPEDVTPTTTVLPGDDTAEATSDDAATEQPEPETATPVADEALPAEPAPVDRVAQITSIVSFDPEGDFAENSDLAMDAIADGDPSTLWRTSCYSNQFMGAKRGVGLVVSFDRPLEQGIELRVESAPYQIQFYEWDGDTAPITVDGWGEPFDRSFGPDPAQITVDASGFGARHLLLLLNEIGTDDGCSTDNPYRGSIDEINVLG
ncbi:serine/threonine protein kinase [Ilumatobacter sp.]|uniref:serine/threonine protein kinase n=1 Tax=Ilumatobacter sp. TaxID=1967498 RepID=UPI003C5FAB7A